MTREEAIKLLRKMRETIDRNNAYGEAEEMGIQALEQEPTNVIATGDGAYYKIKACEDANANQHNSNALNDVGQHTNALEGDAISRQALLDAFGFSEKTRKWDGDHSGYNTMMLYEIQDMIESAPSVISHEPTGHCEDCKHFRKLPYHADALGKCIHHGGFCPKGDWYCADFEPQEGSE